MNHRWEKLSPCCIDGSSNMKKILAEHIENLHEMLPFKYVLAFELNSSCTCTLSTDIGCRYILFTYVHDCDRRNGFPQYMNSLVYLRYTVYTPIWMTPVDSSKHSETSISVETYRSGCIINVNVIRHGLSEDAHCVLDYLFQCAHIEYITHGHHSVNMVKQEKLLPISPMYAI